MTQLSYSQRIIFHGACIYTETVNCDNLANPQNGQVSQSGISAGSVATYTCSPGFILVGVEARVCQINGAWSGSAPACKSKILLRTKG